VGDRADVVVTFEDPRANFVFWRGTSYIPHWVTQNDIWYNNQFVERRSNTDGCIGCVEPMSDKKCRFSHVRVLHSTPARTVIHWRYAPIGLKHKHPYIDPYSGQGDWVDEYYTIYPDLVGVRSITLHSTAIDEFTDWQEAIIVHPPGRMPEDNIKATALSIGNLKGEVTDYTWPETSKLRNLMNVPARGCIQVVNLKSDVSPFMIVPPTDKIRISLFRNHGPNSMFRHWNHWPVAHGMSSTTPAFDASKPSHTSLTSWKNWQLYRSTDNSRTHLMLHGVTDKECKDLAILGKSWILPAKAEVVSGNYRSDGFDMEQRAYVVELQNPDKADALHLKLDANDRSPLVNPAIVVKNSEPTEIRIKPLPVMAKVKEQPPNIIFLMADDLGYGDTGFNGNTVIRTPNLDTMAQDGIRFTRFYSIGPVCAPTRASCLTGRHYMRFGMMDVNVGKLPEQEITLAKVCKAKGYATGHFGKWHLGTMSRTESARHKDPAKDYAPPWTRDYDDAFATEISVPTWNPASGTYAKHDAPYWHNGKKVTQNLEGDDSRVIMDRAIPFIQKAVGDNTPFMTTIWFHAPHSPVVAGPTYLKMYEGYTEGQQHYYGCITAMDEQIGRLRSELKKLGIDKNTIIWFCSDNGPEGSGKPKPIYDAYHGAFYGETGGFRGRKRFLYNGGVCVPAVAVWPGTVTKGQTVHVPCSTLDYLPTVCEAIGSDYPDDRPVDGESLLSLLLGKTKTRKSYIPFASNIRLPRAAIIKGDFKLCTNVSSAEEDALYHLQDDPAESDNLIADKPKLAESMMADLQAWIESCRKSFDGNDYSEPYEKQGTFLKYGE
ncbi:MAG: sulfatase family protein, partial [Planctomycetota bacterium]